LKRYVRSLPLHVSPLPPSFLLSLPFRFSLSLPFAHLDTESLTQTHTLTHSDTHTHTHTLMLTFTFSVSRTPYLSLSLSHTGARNLSLSFSRSACLLHTQITDTLHRDDTGARQEANFGPASTTAFRSRGNHGGLFVDPPVTYSFPSVEDPTLGTYSDRGHQGFWLLINIFHIILKCRL